MSWGIKLFAEKRRRGSDKWEMIGVSNIISEVKHMLITDTMENVNYDIDIEENTFDSVENSELSKGILDYYDGEIDRYHWVKTYPLKSMSLLCDNLINKYQNTMLMCFKALGIKAELNDYAYYILDINDNKYTASGDISKSYNPLTYPINKELLEQLNNESAGYYKAVWWRGILSIIQDMAMEDWELDNDAEIRLVFVRSC